MWLITNFGFFSVVQKPDDPKLGTLTVRSRVLEDLESLKEQYFKQTMGEIQVNAGIDYKYRAKVPREAMAGARQKAQHGNANMRSIANSYSVLSSITGTRKTVKVTLRMLNGSGTRQNFGACPSMGLTPCATR